MTPLLLASALVILAIIALALSFIRASRRTRQKLINAQQAHEQALARLAAEDLSRRLIPNRSDGWASLEGTEGAVQLRLTAGADLKKTTFIRYATTLTVQPAAGTFPLQGEERVVDLADPRQPPPMLTALGLEQQHVQELMTLVSSLQVEARRLVLNACPGRSSTHRYSFGIHLLLDPPALDRLWRLGHLLGNHLLR